MLASLTVALGLSTSLVGTTESGAPTKVEALPYVDNKGFLDAATGKVYAVALKAYATYVIEMKAKTDKAESDARFRPHLQVKGGTQVVAVSNGEMRWTPKAQTHVIFACSKDGTYHIVAGTHAGGAVAFRLAIRQLDSQIERESGKIVLEVPEPPEKRAALTAQDKKDSAHGTPAKPYPPEGFLPFKKDHTYDIEMRAFSRIFGPYLRLENAEGRQVKCSGSRDIAGDGLADEFGARLRYYAREDGNFKIIATNSTGMLGEFHLAVRERKARVRDIPDGARLEIRDALTKADPRDGVLKTSPSKSYLVRFKSGHTYDIELRTLKSGHHDSAIWFDAVLRLEDDGGRELAFNDDEEAGFVRPSSTDSRITFTAPRDGTYRIVATSLDAYYVNTAKYPQAGCGVFALSVQQRPVNKPFDGKPIEDRLTYEDTKDRVFTDSPSKSYTLPLVAGKKYQVELRVDGFHGFIRLEDHNRKQLHASYDVTLRNPNARLVFSCERTGAYHIVVGSLHSRIGRFTLTITELKEADAGSKSP